MAIKHIILTTSGHILGEWPTSAEALAAFTAMYEQDELDPDTYIIAMKVEPLEEQQQQ